MGLFNNKLNDKVATLANSKKDMRVQHTYARDFYEDCTVPVLQWLALDLSEGLAGSGYLTSLKKLECFKRAYELAVGTYDNGSSWIRDSKTIAHVGFDPIKDQFYFIFKFENNGDVCFVSERGVDGVENPV